MFQRHRQASQWQLFRQRIGGRQCEYPLRRSQGRRQTPPVGVEGGDWCTIIARAERLQRQLPNPAWLPSGRRLQVATQLTQHQRWLPFTVVAHIAPLITQVQGVARGHQCLQKQIAVIAAARTVTGARAVIGHQVKTQRRPLTRELTIVEAQQRHHPERNRTHGDHRTHRDLPGQKLATGARGAGEAAAHRMPHYRQR